MLKVGAIYSITSSISAVVSMAVGLLNMRWLGPELLGIWQSVTIINSYLPFLQLGIQSGLNIELPILLGSNKLQDANIYVGTAKSFAIILSFLIGIAGIIVCTYLFFSIIDAKIKISILAIIVLAISTCFQLHLIATYRSASAFDKLSKIYVVDTIVTLLLVYFIWKYHYYGLVFYNVVKEMIKTILMYAYAPYRKIKISFDKGVFVKLLKRGVLMMGLTQINGVIQSIPRVLLLYLGGVIQVGLFSPALAMQGVMSLIPNQLVQFLQPQFGYMYGQTKKASTLMVYINKLTVYLPIMILPFSILGFFLIGPIIKFFFPNYISSLWAVKILIIGFVFSTSGITRNILITIKAYREVYFLYILDCFLFVLMPYIVISSNYFSLLSSVAIGLSVSYFISYLLNYWVIIKTIVKPEYN